jgi:small subunit ribosomal protein S16
MQRIGRRHDPHFRILVTDARRGPKSGKFIEILGSYNAKLGEIKLKEDRIKYWIGVGAQVSDTVWNFLVKKGVIKGETRNALPKKSPIEKEPEQEEAPAEEKEETPTETEKEGKTAEGEEKPEEKVEEPKEVASEKEEEQEEKKEEAPAEEPKKEEKPEEEKSE